MSLLCLLRLLWSGLVLHLAFSDLNSSEDIGHVVYSFSRGTMAFWDEHRTREVSVSSRCVRGYGLPTGLPTGDVNLDTCLRLVVFARSPHCQVTFPPVQTLFCGSMWQSAALLRIKPYFLEAEIAT